MQSSMMRFLHRFGVVLGLCGFSFACAATELELSPDHPAHPAAPMQRLAPLTAFQSRFVAESTGQGGPVDAHAAHEHVLPPERRSAPHGPDHDPAGHDHGSGHDHGATGHDHGSKHDLGARSSPGSDQTQGTGRGQGTVEPARSEPMAPERPAAASKPRSGVKPPAGVKEAPEVFVCPMHPDVRMKEPDRCPLCGMTLVPRKERP